LKGGISGLNQASRPDCADWAALEPGGYLQWDEMDFNTLYPSAANPSAPTPAAEKFVGVWKHELLKSDITFE